MKSHTELPLTNILRKWQQDLPFNHHHLFSIIYSELRNIARSHLKKEARAFSLQTDLLVNEAFLRLKKQVGVPWKSRFHFFAIATRSIKQFLVENARVRNTGKRGQGKSNLPIDEMYELSQNENPKILALREALNELKVLAPRKAAIIELRFCGGLSNEQIANLLQISLSTVKRDWEKSKVWLRENLKNHSL